MDQAQLHEELIHLAVKFVNTMMNCASSDISPADFWARAQTAATTAGKRTHWSGIVAKAAEKLQTPEGGIYESDAKALAEIEARLRELDALTQWRNVISNEAVWVCAVARIERSAAKKAKRDAKVTLADVGRI